MKTQTSIAARTCRLHEWAQMIQECNLRPVGMSVSEWCQANSITKANYYYRMTQVRKACLDAIPDGVIEQKIVPVPANVMFSEDPVNKKDEPLCEDTFIEVVSHGVTLRITERTSDSLIAKVLGVLAHAE